LIVAGDRAASGTGFVKAAHFAKSTSRVMPEAFEAVAAEAVPQQSLRLTGL
jgi:hypothetical protein